MLTKNWLLKLKNSKILKEVIIDGKIILRLQNPCKIAVSEEVIEKLRKGYDPKLEKGGFLIAKPKKVGIETHLLVQQVKFIKNISSEPESKYSPDPIEFKSTIDKAIGNLGGRTLPIIFHTHPISSDNEIEKSIEFNLQANTSSQDQKASDFTILCEDLNLLLPDALFIGNENLANIMFLGFYNGNIAPKDFETFRKEKIGASAEMILNKFANWAKNQNPLLLLGGGLLIAMGLLKKPDILIPIFLGSAITIPTLINNQHSSPNYYAYISKGSVTINIP